MHKTIQKFVLNLIIICKSCLNFCATITNGHSLWAHERHKILYKNIHRSIIFINWSSKNPQFAFSNSFNKKIPWMICLNRNFHITRYFWLFGPKITSTPQKKTFIPSTISSWEDIEISLSIFVRPWTFYLKKNTYIPFGNSYWNINQTEYYFVIIMAASRSHQTNDWQKQVLCR